MTSVESPVSDVSDLVPSDGTGETDGTTSDTVATHADTTTQESRADESTPAPSIDVIFEVLKNERRRRVIEYLRHNDGPAELGDVAEHIAALENDKEPAAITYAERKRVYVGLYQCHLPKMDDMGVVAFNRARGRIELTEQTHHLLPYLDGPESAGNWHHYYGAIVLGGMGLYGLSLSSVVPTIPAVQLSLMAVLLAVAACTLVHYSRHSADSQPR